MRPTREPPAAEIVVCAACVGMAILVGVYFVVTLAINPPRVETDTVYVLRDPAAQSRFVRIAHVRAPNERAARMRLALYEHDSKWEDAKQTTCVPAIHDPADMLVERVP